MNHEAIISAALRALPSDNLRKEEMFAVECALRMVADLVVAEVVAIPADKNAEIMELRIRVAELDKALCNKRDLVSRLMRENARINLGNMFERGEQASEELTHEFVVYAPKTKIEGANIPTEDTQP